MESVRRRPRPIPFRRPLTAALALSLAAGPMLMSAHAWAAASPSPSSVQDGSDQPPDRSPRTAPTEPRRVRPAVRAPGVYVVDVDAAVGATTFGEASIAINPANPQQIAITRFTFPWNSNADFVYSSDGGVTWADEATIPAPPGVANTAGGPNDQTIDYGRNGTLYATFLTGGNQIVTGSTTDPTQTSSWSWNNPTPTTTQITSAANTNADQPWLIVNQDTTTPTQDNVYVGYQDFRNSVPHDRVAVSLNNASPVNITRDNAAGTGTLSGGVINGGLRLAADHRNGTMYALYQQGGGTTQPQNVTLRLNRSTDAGQTWNLGGTSNTNGIAVTTDNTRQGNSGYKFGGVNSLQGGIDHLAVDPTNGDVYVAYGADVSGNNQIRIRRLTDNGSGGMNVGGAVNVSTSTNAALPSVAVLNDGTIGVLYLTNDGNNASGFPEFTAHLARSTDHGATFSDTALQSYTTAVGDSTQPTQRLFGDYQQLKAVGNTFYGAFIGNLNGLSQTTAQPTDTIFFAVPQTTKSTLSSPANPSLYGQPVHFTATVVPPPDGGTVTFKVDGTQLGSPVAVDTTTGTATSDDISSLTVGPHNVDATYSGDPNYVGDTAMTLVQTVEKAPVNTTLASSANPSPFGQPTTFTDTVCAAFPSTHPTLPPSGTVTFRDGSTLLGTGTLAPGGGTNCAQTQVSFGNLLPGTHTITAQYSGDGNYLTGNLETLTQAVACTRTITGTVGELFTSGQSTCIINATVNGTVHDASDGALFISNSTVKGAVLFSRGTLFGMCGTTVTGTTSIQGASGFVLVGDPGDDGCTGNRINGSLLLSNNHGGLEVIANQVGGSVQVQGTTGTGPFPEDSRAEIEGNTIGGSLSCSGNTPPPTNDGHPNTVTGPRLGQCSTL
ncbi:Ig-like domain repeat protein [Kitasatospora sp. NPDC097643]|uniref:Ig-like domain repeat protein n=1 Tax=Kitasatospora sp. NPDC097643 TaxID=3157230 RepID=UPI003332E699